MSNIIKIKAPKSGCIIVASDAHYWPGRIPTAQLAMEYVVSAAKPAAIVMNGDVLDAPTISRHPPIGWEKHPSLAKELKVAQQQLANIKKVAPVSCRLLWPLGNHDARFNTKLAASSPQFKNVPGTRLMDHFPDWEPCWRVDIGDKVTIKHEYKGGTHAAYLNAKHAGKTIVTGHLHSQKVVPVSDYMGTRYGVDAGMLAAVDGPQFNYNEANPKDWRSGFVILSFSSGMLLPPELVTVLDEKRRVWYWNGQLYKSTANGRTA